jgi:2-dehydro-3-deoxyphosphogluconate aldolase / (4S)-4-hydroxy-2-oxoglutarate aldolase
LNESLHDILKRAVVVPVIVVDDIRHAVPLAEALVSGGLTVLEVTLRTPVALDAITAMRRAVPQAIVGVGTITEAAHVRSSVDAGAQFGVSPGLHPELVAATKAANLPYLPGIATVSELMQARLLGLRLCKFFPAQQAGGVAMLRTFYSVIPDVAFCPTGGIDSRNAPDFLALPNVVCVGGSWVTPAALLKSGSWDQIRALAQAAAAMGQPSH